MEWKEVYIKDICTVLGDGLHGTPEYDEKGNFYFINGNNLQEGHITIKKDTKRVSQKEFLKYKKELNDRSILVSINGTIGNVAKYNNEPCILGKSACFFNVKEDIDRNFIYYVISSAHFKKSIIQQATGTTIKNVSLKQMRDYHFLIPVNLSDQRKIAGILSALDSKIENNNKINANLEAQAQALFKSWFVDFTPFKDQPFVDSELGPIPQGWKVVSLDDVTSKVGTGLNPRKNFTLGQGSNYYVTIKNMYNNRVYLDSRCDKITDEAIQKIQKRSKLQVGDLLFSGIGTIGRVALINKSPYNWNTSESVFNLHPSEEISSEFLYLLLLSNFFQNYVKINTLGGVQQGIRMASLKSFRMALPDRNVLIAFDRIIQPIVADIKRNDDENDSLAALRDTLLPKLMSGEIKL